MRVSTSTLVALGIGMAGCASPAARIHPDFRSRSPETIQIDVRNETLHDDLDRYRVSRLLQTSIFGPSEVNVFGVLYQATREQLIELGYSVERVRPVDDDKPASGAVMRVRVLRWGLVPTSVGRGLRAQLEFELVEYPADEALYQRSQVMDTSRSFSSYPGLSGVELQNSLRRTVRRGLASLPPRSGGPP